MEENEIKITCYTCKKVKPEWLFSPSALTNISVSSRCKQCSAEYMKKRRHKIAEMEGRVIIQRRRFSISDKLMYIDMYNKADNGSKVRLLDDLGINRHTFNVWLSKYKKGELK